MQGNFGPAYEPRKCILASREFPLIRYTPIVEPAWSEIGHAFPSFGVSMDSPATH
jgi:hypothetical protein